MAHGSEGQLGKGLRQRHLAMIAIGGVIGAGLFVGSGAVIAEVGPGAFLTYALTGVLIIMVMRMLGEMAAANPATGSLQTRTPVDRRVGRLLGGLALLVLLGDRRGL
jgi:GABA permease